MSIELKIEFDPSAFARIDAIRASLPETLMGIVTEGRNYVRSKVMNEKLSGQVLNRRTGTLLRSIQEGGGPPVFFGPYAVRANVGTNIWYGRMWEETGHGEIRPVNKKALFWPGAAHPVAFVRAQAPRPFLRPSIEESSPAFEAIAKRRMAAALRGQA
jgi:hypothetical protein